MATRTKVGREPKRLTDILFNKRNNDLIILENDKGEEVTFSQIYATIIEGVVYCILAPVEGIYTKHTDDAFLFALDEDDSLVIVNDMRLAEKIFDEYYIEVLDEVG